MKVYSYQEKKVGYDDKLGKQEQDQRTYENAAQARRVMSVDEAGNYVAGGGSSGGGSVTMPSTIIKDYITHDLDEASSPITYIGKLNNAGDWLLVKMDETSELDLTYANISNNISYTTYATAWAARASLTYEDLDQLTFSTSTIPQQSVYVDCAVETPVDFYLYQTAATPTITVNTAIDDKILTVDSTTGVVVGHAITLYEGINMFQSVIKSTTATSITLSSGLDFAFTTGTLVECGNWNMAVDGSTTTQVFKIKSPSGININAHSIHVSMLDGSAMDDGKFGGLTQLNNGIIFRLEDGTIKNLAMIVNNIGFYEVGFDTEYASKAPAGQYGFRATRDIWKTNGTVLKLSGPDSSEFQLHVQDDLSDLDLLACTIGGHTTSN